MPNRLRVTYRKSAIGYDQSHKDAIRTLGLRRLNQTVEHDDNSSIRGMVFKVKHLVDVEEVSQ
jgi:large subunit ribosomal protein L30